MTEQEASHKLRDLLETLESGGRPKGGVGGIKEGIPSVGGEHITRSGGFDFRDIRFIPEKYFRSMNRGLIKRGDILLVKDGATTGKVAFVHEDFQYSEAAVNEHVFIVRPYKDKVLAKYLFFFLQSRVGQSQILSNFHGAAQGGINSSFAENVVVPTPPIDLQQKITTILDTAYKLKRKREYTNQLTNKVIQSEFHKLFGDPTTNAMRWKIVRVGDVVLETQYGLSKALDDDREHAPVMRMNNITTNGSLDLSELRYVDIDKDEFERYSVKNGDLLFNRTNSRELVGKTGLVAGEEGFVFASYLIRVKVNRTVVTPEYLWAFLNSPFGKQILFRKARGAIGQANINTQELKSMEFPLPPMEIQIRFSGLVAKMGQLNRRQAESTLQIDQLFESLEQEAFN